MADAAGAVPFVELFQSLPLARRRRLVRRFGEDQVLAAMMGSGSLRTAQLPPPGNWGIWVILAGRGFGKTPAGAEWLHGAAAAGGKRIALVAPTLDVARAVNVPLIASNLQNRVSGA